MAHAAEARPARRLIHHGRSGSPFDDDQPIYAPHVLECQFCPTNSDNVVASFDDLSKCEIDKPRKRGVLTHKAGPIADGE